MQKETELQAHDYNVGNVHTSDEPELEFSDLSRAELGHFNFRAEIELTIPKKYRKFLFNHFFPKFLLSDFACISCS